MTRIFMSNTQANFERIVSHAEFKLMLGKRDAQFLADTMIITHKMVYVCITDQHGEVIANAGDKTAQPRIWTHRPLPIGFPIEAIRDQFEQQHIPVIGDMNDVLDVTTTGGRYNNPVVRACWMTYIELAITHFNTPL